MTPYPSYQSQENPLGPLVQAWEGRLEKARQHKEPWQEIADECEMFYSAACGFLWDPKYAHKFWSTTEGPINPTFRITIARAFELVALFGPTLYWANAVRTANPRDLPQLPPELFGPQQDPQQIQQMMSSGDPQAMQMAQQAIQQQQMLQQVAQEQQQEMLQRNMAAQLQGMVLNHTPDLLELDDHSERAITDLLIKGRGVLVTEPYRHPGSSKLLVGSFFESPDRVFIDPDCERAKSAWWMMVEKFEPYWEVERKFKLSPPGVLKNASTYQSASSQGADWSKNLITAQNQRATGESKDYIRYYEVYSRMGVGIRDMELPNAMQQALEAAGGNNVFLAIAPGIPYLLNCPDWVLQQGTVDDVRQRLQWPLTLWTEGKYPLSFLDVYQRTRYPWPLSPLAPGLGELKAINVFLCSLCHHIWMSSRTLIGVLNSAAEEVRTQLERGRDFAVIGLEDLNKNMQEVIQFLEHPPVKLEVWKILDALMQMFDRRVGLTEILYGMQGQTQSRSAADVKIRQSNVSIRPQDMARRVAAWQRMIARKEAYGLWYACQPDDFSDILGRVGAQMWGRFVKSQSGERIIRQIDYGVEATSMQRPNLERDSENLTGFLQVFGPIHQAYAAGQIPGDVSTLNGLQRMWGRATGMKVDELMLQPAPPPDPSQNPEMLKLQAEQEARQQEMQLKTAETQQKLQAQQAEAALREREAQQKLAQAAQEHALRMRAEMESAAMRLTTEQAQTRQKIQQGRIQIALTKQKAKAQANGKPAASKT